MSASPSVAVLISAGRHPSSAAPRACRGDAVALAVARAIGGEATRVLHAGDANEPALQDYLAYGAARIGVVPCDFDQDALAYIADHVRTADIVVTGMQSEQGGGSGLFPYLLAKALNRPLVENVLAVTTETGRVRARQFLPKGQRRTIEAPLPVVLAVHSLAPCSLTYAHARRMSGSIETLADISDPHDTPPQLTWSLDPDLRQPQRLKAVDQKNGHARMLSLIETKARGGAVVFEGSSVDKAQILLTYLRENRIVDF